MIYPEIRKNNLNGEKIKVSSVKVAGDCLGLAERVFTDNNIALNGTYEVEIKIADTRRTTYIDEISKITDEKIYY